jgi:hypothetical protein
VYLFLNNGVTASQYLAELKELRRDAKELIESEIPYLEKITIDPIAVPVLPAAPSSPDTSPVE